MKSSLEEFVCMGESKERLMKALGLVMYEKECKAWTDVFGGFVVITDTKRNPSDPGWHKLPPGLGAREIAALFWPYLCDTKPTNTGPDGELGHAGWKVALTPDGVVHILPWWLYYA